MIYHVVDASGNGEVRYFVGWTDGTMEEPGWSGDSAHAHGFPSYDSADAVAEFLNKRLRVFCFVAVEGRFDA